ncbi:MAG: hypothetical protein GY953_40920, partial [bacterium]|nr:hypothetical protein [bacterium]
TSRGAIYNPGGLNVGRLIELSAEAGSDVVLQYEDAERIDRAALLELPVDVLCPCARYHSIHPDNIDRIRARLVCPGGNNPVSPDAVRCLADRGVLCLPDFVTNCGGVLGGTMEFAAVAPRRIESLIDQHIGRRVTSLLREAEGRQESPAVLAERAALRRFENVRALATKKSPLGRLFDLALECHRRGWTPESLVGAIAPRYFERLLTHEGDSEG